MKKIYLLLALIFMCTGLSFACEICGCGVGNFYMGMLPNFKSKFIGVRYSYMHYQTELASDKTQFSNDFYKTTEIWGGWNIGNRWQVLAFVPYRFNKKISDDGVKETNGLGDITLLANYKLLHTRKVNESNRATEQQLWVGGGLQLPTGAYHVDMSDPDANIGEANSQPGTGSVGVLFNSMYNISFNRLGINASANYRINTVNPDQYRFGNKIAINGLAYYRIRLGGGIVVSPNLGLLYEHAAANEFAGNAVDQTGGYLLNASAGVEINFNKITVGFNTQMPVSQNFAEGQTVSKNRGILHVSFAL